MGELIKEIEGFDGRYTISESGIIINTHTNKIIKPWLSIHGYYNVTLSDNQVKKNKRVHRLLAITFITNPDPEKFNIVNHLDKNPQNNHLSNLEWTDTAGNSKNCRISKNNKTGYYGVYYHKQNKKYVAEITINYKKFYLGGYNTPEEAALAYDKVAKENGFGHYNFNIYKKEILINELLITRRF